MNIMFAGFFGGWEIVLILAVVLILFGAKKLPELAKGLGQGIKEFKKATRDVTEEIHSAMDDDSSKPTSYPPQKKTFQRKVLRPPRPPFPSPPSTKPDNPYLTQFSPWQLSPMRCVPLSKRTTVAGR